MAAYIAGCGYAVPDKVLFNTDLEQMVATNDQWIIERTGIRERRIADPETPTSVLALQAARQALERSGVAPMDLDLIIVTTVTPDMMFPATACLLQADLGAERAAAFDLEAGCTGFIYGLAVGEKFVNAGYQNVLVVGAETLSRITDYSDRSTCILFGDGAGAVVLSARTGGGEIISTLIGADGRGQDLLYLKGGGSLHPASLETVSGREHYIRMNGNEVFRWASRILPEVSAQILEQAGYGWSDVALFIPHQANLRIITTAAKRMGIPWERMVVNLDRFGNMSAASIPVALAMAEEEGRLQTGDLVLMVGFGAGLTYGGSLVRWGRNDGYGA